MLNARGGSVLIGVGEDKQTKEYISLVGRDFQWMEKQIPIQI